MPRSGGGENVEKSKDERIKIKVESDGATEILHILLLTLAPSGVDRWFAALIENLFNFYIKEWSGMTNSRIMSTLDQLLHYRFNYSGIAGE